jgi:hypothetical protein
MLKAESQVANSNTEKKVKPLRVQLLLLNKYSKSTPVYFVKRLSLCVTSLKGTDLSIATY